MTTSKRLLVGFASLMILGFIADSARADWVNGWWIYPYKYFLNDSVMRRPYTPTDKGLSLSDLRIDRTPLNHKGIGLGATRTLTGPNWAYRWIAVWHCEISNIWRTPGAHTDFVQVCGGGNSQDVPTTLLLQDLNLHDGEGIPVMIEDGIFDKITLKDIRVKNTTVCLQVTAMNTGSIGTIVVDHCPNMSIAVMGRPGAIGTVYVKNSPGLRISDVMNKYGKSGAKIIYLN